MIKKVLASILILPLVCWQLSSVKPVKAAVVTVSQAQFSRYSDKVENKLFDLNSRIPIACGTDPATAIFDGAQGIQGERGYSGYSGARGYRGYSGAQGPQGEQGYRGYSGAAATVEIGTVTTVATSVPATVTNSGSLSAAILNFEIPKGVDGDPGTITQSQIETKIAESGGKLYKRALSADTEEMIEIVRFGGTSSLKITAAGLLVIQDANGVHRFAYNMNDGTFTLKRSNGNNSFAISSTGRITL